MLYWAWRYNVLFYTPGMGDIKGAQVQSWRFLGLDFDSYERLPMLYYSLKHVESPLGISSTQTLLFQKV